MIRLASGSSLAFQRLSRRSVYWRGRVGLPPGRYSTTARLTPSVASKRVLASGSEAQVWRLNVHYSRSLTELADFSPVLLSAGGAAGPVRSSCCSGYVRELSPAELPAAAGAQSRGLWGVGGQAARRGVAAGGGPFFPRIPPWRAHFARFSRVRAAMRTAPGARK
eukprot:gene17738-biopygen2352